MRGKSGLERLQKHSITLHTKTGNIFRGVLVASYHDCLVLDKPVLIDPDEQQVDDQQTALGGQAVFPLDNVDYFQIETPWQH